MKPMPPLAALKAARVAAATAAPMADLGDAAVREIEALWWPVARLGEGLEALARFAGLSRGPAQALGAPPSGAADPAAEARRWIDWAGQQLGIEVVPIDAAVPELPALLHRAGPAVLPFEDARGLGFFLLLESRRGRPRLLGPDLQARRCAIETLRAALCWHREAPLGPEMAALLEAAAVPSRRRAGVQAAMLRERLATERIGPCWMLRLPASTGFWRQLAQAHLPRRVGVSLAVFALLYTLEITGWGLIGGATLNGRFDLGWLAAWLLLMLSMVPLRLAGGWLQSTFALDAGRILKSRLLAGALRMDLESVRRQGVGHLLGRVIESQALESLAVSGGLAVVVALLELGFAAWILSRGAAPAAHLTLMAAWIVLIAWLAWRYFARLRRWTLTRLGLTHELIESMVGHRTRLAQERAGRRDTHEDQTTQAYLQASQAMDTAAVPVFAFAPAGWLLVALAGLAPAFVAGTPASALAISLGGILFAQRALAGIAGGMAGLGRAAIAWQQVAELFHAGHQGAAPAQPFLATPPNAAGASRTPLVDATGLGFGYAPNGERVLDNADLRIMPGERILLEGASGGGKSTLASLLVGLRTPQSGLLLLGGLDRHTLGDDWHRVATAAPQFNENHVLSGTIGFNLLMGREWPASSAEVHEAETLCRSLGLGPLLDRMPGGMSQRIGETGWQLSHGERSRIFLARALLQGAPLTIMDESFAALDPETLEICLRCSIAHAQTLLVVAHP
jgi:ATP-binding cassette, subfamily B, bacterial